MKTSLLFCLLGFIYVVFLFVFVWSIFYIDQTDVFCLFISPLLSLFFMFFFFDIVLLPWGRGLPPRQSKRCLLASRVEASRGPWPEWQAGRQRGRQADRETDSQPARQTATETDMTAHNLQPQCFSHRSSNRMYAPRCFVLRTC